jgi:surface antigen
VRTPRLIALFAIALAIAAPAAVPAPVAAGTAPFPVALTVTASARTASLNVVDVLARTVAGVRCTLTVGVGRRTSHFPSASVGAAQTAHWRWVPVGLAGDTRWRFTVTCRQGSLWSQRWLGVEPGFPSRGGALALAAAGAGARCDPQGVCLADNPFPVGQCTWYAQGRRPDLLGLVSGDAGDWLAEVQGRVPEGWRPAIGALAVWLPFRERMSADGHVAYVAAVSRGRILLDDSNWIPTDTSPELQVHEHWMSAASPTGYIYGGPAGAGP